MSKLQKLSVQCSGQLLTKTEVKVRRSGILQETDRPLKRRVLEAVHLGTFSTAQSSLWTAPFKDSARGRSHSGAVKRHWSTTQYRVVSCQRKAIRHPWVLLAEAGGWRQGSREPMGLCVPGPTRPPTHSRDALHLYSVLSTQYLLYHLV